MRNFLLTIILIVLAAAAFGQTRSHGQADSVTSIDGQNNGTFSGTYTHVAGSGAPHPWFSFCAEAGQTVTVDVDTSAWSGGSAIFFYGDFDRFVEAGDARTVDFSNALQQSGGGSTVYSANFTPASDGRFLIQLDSWAGGGGAYTVTVSGAAAECSFADVSVTKTAPASVTAGNQMTYSISATNNPSATEVTLSDDTLSAAIPLPFSFDFLGQTKTQVFISSNGFLSFSGDENGCCIGDPIPTAATPNDFIAFFWEDLNPAVGGAIYYETIGTSPDQRFIVQFDAVPHFTNSTNVVTAQVILYEGSNDIEFQYLDAPSNGDGDPTTVGIENFDGTAGTQIANAEVSYSNQGFLIQQPSTVTAIGGNFRDISNNDAASLVVTDPLPAGTTFVSSTGCTNTPSGPTVSCQLGTLATGGSTSFSFDVQVDSSAMGTLNNTATQTSGAIDAVSSNDSSTASTTVGTEADMAITKTGPATATAGTQVTYDITVTNNGPSDAQSVSVADPTPTGYTFASATAPCTGGFPCAIGTVTSGTNVAFSVTYDIDPATTGDVTNTATVSTATTDPTAGNDAASATTTVGAEADMAITKTGPATATAGTQVTYDITVTNNGPSDAQSVSVADPTPTGYTFASATAPCTGGFPCAIGTVPASSTVAFSVTYDIDPATSGDVTNTATVSTATTDPTAGNDSASATTTIGAEADMAITKTGPATATAGTQVTYDITVTNNGPSDAQSVSVADPTPTGYTFASATAPCTGGFPCAIGTVTSGSTVAFSVTYDIDAATTGDVTNTATVSTAATDPTAGNDSASATTTVGSEADLSIVKTASANTVELGDEVVYTITVSNAGPSDATNVVVTDNLPSGQELVSTSGCAEDPNGAPTCTLGTIQTGASATYTLTARIVQASSVPQSNTASVTSNASDPNGANNASSAVISIAFSIPTLGPLGLLSLMLMVMLIAGTQVRRMS